MIASTRRGETHIGTLLLSLPSTYTGGALVVRQNGHEVCFDWSQTPSLQWAFLYSDCEHEVLPVTSGHRITIQYNIFDTPADISSGPVVAIDSRLSFINNTIDSLMEADQAVTLGFALRHEYPRNVRSSTVIDSNRLKGHDRLVMQVIQAKGLKWGFRAVWQMTKYDWDERDDDHLERSQEYEDAQAKLKADHPGPSYKLVEEMRNELRTAFEARRDAQWNRVFRHRCLTSKSFNIMNNAYLEQATWDYLEENGAEARDDVLWMSKPQKYDGQSSFITYGNEAQTTSIYTAVAIFVHIPDKEEVTDPGRSFICNLFFNSCSGAIASMS